MSNETNDGQSETTTIQVSTWEEKFLEKMDMLSDLQRSQVLSLVVLMSRHKYTTLYTILQDVLLEGIEVRLKLSSVKPDVNKPNR